MRYLLVVTFVVFSSATLYASDSRDFDNGPPKRDQLVITPWTNYSITIGGGATKASTKVVDWASWRRVGDTMEISYTYGHTNNAGTGAGSGMYLFPLPSGYTADESKVQYQSRTESAHNVLGTASVYYISGGTTDRAIGYVKLRASSNLALELVGNDTVTKSLGSTAWPMTGSTVFIKMFARVPIVEWGR